MLHPSVAERASLGRHRGHVRHHACKLLPRTVITKFAPRYVPHCERRDAWQVCAAASSTEIAQSSSWDYKYERRNCSSPCHPSDMRCLKMEALFQNVLGYPRLPPRVYRFVSSSRLRDALSSAGLHISLAYYVHAMVSLLVSPISSSQSVFFFG